MQNLKLLSFLLVIVFTVSCRKQPKANFTVNTSHPETGEEIQFLNESVNEFWYEWDFGDGATSTSRNPTHTYLSPGNYSVNLTVTDEKKKKSDSFSRMLNVEQNYLNLMLGLWNYEQAIIKSYEDDVLTDSAVIDLDDLFTIHTMEFKSDSTVKVVFDADVTLNTWVLNNNQGYFTIEDEHYHIDVLNSTTFHFHNDSYSEFEGVIYKEVVEAKLTR